MQTIEEVKGHCKIVADEIAKAVEGWERSLHFLKPPKMLMALVSSLLVMAASAEQYRLKLPTTVDIVEDGEMTGAKKLKAGTVFEIVEPTVSSDANGKVKKVQAKSAHKLTPSKISPIMFKNTQPATAVLRAKIEMGDSYYGPFDGMDKAYWAIVVRAYNDGWEDCETLYAYVSRSSKMAKTIVAVVKDGKEHACYVKVKPVKYGDEKDYITIEDFELVDVPDSRGSE